MRQKLSASFESQQSFLRLGERFRLARKARGLTLAMLESKCGIHRSTLGRLERGDLGVTAHVMLAVLEALQELADVELLLTDPAAPRHTREHKTAVLDSDF
jgi:transcriptional regulator with XRE-family HTH domain